MNEFSQLCQENDLNGFAELIFSGDCERWKLAEAYPKLKGKLDLTLAFYQKLDAGFTEKHFRALGK